jgi:hypothetical protein
VRAPQILWIRCLHRLEAVNQDLHSASGFGGEFDSHVGERVAVLPLAHELAHCLGKGFGLVDGVYAVERAIGKAVDSSDLELEINYSFDLA